MLSAMVMHDIVTSSVSCSLDDAMYSGQARKPELMTRKATALDSVMGICSTLAAAIHHVVSIRSTNGVPVSDPLCPTEHAQLLSLVKRYRQEEMALSIFPVLEMVLHDGRYHMRLFVVHDDAMLAALHHR